MSLVASWAAALAESLDKPLEWDIGFFFGNTGPSLELWTVIGGFRGSMINGDLT
jgi:hypothetical protein